MKKSKLWSCLLCFCIAAAILLLCTDYVKAANAEPIDGSREGTYMYDMTELRGQVYIPIQVAEPGESILDISVTNAQEHLTFFTLKDHDVGRIENWVVNGETRSQSQCSYICREATTYYLYLLLPDSEHNVVTVKSSFRKATGDVTLEPGKWHEAVQAAEKLFYKIEMPTKGYIQVEGSSWSRLLDYKKQKLSGEFVNDNIFALRPGIYYIQSNKTGSYKIRYTFHAVKPSGAGGDEISSAKKIKLGQKITIFSPMKKSGWNKKIKMFYKIKIPKKKKISASTVSYSHTGAVRLYPCKKKADLADLTGVGMISVGDNSGTEKKEYFRTLNDKGKYVDQVFSPGTYYIEVSMHSVNGGVYSFTLK